MIDMNKVGWSGKDYADVSELLGKTIVDIQVGDNQIDFVLDDNTIYVMYHEQDCCENVSIEDLVGDVSDLLFSPLLEAEVVSNSEEAAQSEWEDSWTWTYYKLGTIKGHVSIRWYGSSNGYYSESVDYARLKEKRQGYTSSQTGDTDEDI